MPAKRIKGDYSSLEEYLSVPEIKAAFWLKVCTGEPDDCWKWEGARDENGYGFFWCLTKNYRAHRISFFYTYGFFPSIGRHQCDNPPCCNPYHILNGTKKDNTQDCIDRKRFPVGERNGKSKLTAEQVVSIFNDPRSSRDIAKDYGLGKSTVGSIKRGEAWKEAIR